MKKFLVFIGLTILLSAIFYWMMSYYVEKNQPKPSFVSQSNDQSGWIKNYLRVGNLHYSKNVFTFDVENHSEETIKKIENIGYSLSNKRKNEKITWLNYQLEFVKFETISFNEPLSLIPDHEYTIQFYIRYHNEIIPIDKSHIDS